MKTKKPSGKQRIPVAKKKNIMYVTSVFFVISLFFTLINLQSFSILPSWLNISSIILFFCSFLLLGYGYFLSKNYDNWYKLGWLTFLYLIILSTQSLLTSNGLYMLGVEDGQIKENLDYIKLTMQIYFGALFIFLVFSFFISNPKLRQLNSYKAYVFGTIIAICIIILIFAVLIQIRNTLFTDLKTVKSTYQFLVGSLLILFPATVLGFSIIRVKLGGSN